MHIYTDRDCPCLSHPLRPLAVSSGLQGVRKVDPVILGKAALTGENEPPLTGPSIFFGFVDTQRRRLVLPIADEITHCGLGWKAPFGKHPRRRNIPFNGIFSER